MEADLPMYTDSTRKQLTTLYTRQGARVVLFDKLVYTIIQTLLAIRCPAQTESLCWSKHVEQKTPGPRGVTPAIVPPTTFVAVSNRTAQSNGHTTLSTKALCVVLPTRLLLE